MKKEALLYKIVRPIISFLFKLIYRPKIIGSENIPKMGRVVIAGNHTDNFDSLLLMSSTKRCIHFLAKDELWQGPKKLIFNHLGLIPVNRKIHDHHALELAYEYLESDKVIGIFPEGTLRKVRTDIIPFKIGAVKMASATNSPIVPFKITGKYTIFSKDLQIIFDKPIYINSDDLEKENIKLRNKIINLTRGDN